MGIYRRYSPGVCVHVREIETDVMVDALLMTFLLHRPLSLHLRETLTHRPVDCAIKHNPQDGIPLPENTHERLYIAFRTRQQWSQE